MIAWWWIIPAFVLGFEIASEAGRRIYNRKMDDTRARLEELRAMLGNAKGAA